MLVLLMLLGICVPAMADGEKEYLTYSSYACFGDSIAAGCALSKDGTETDFSVGITSEGFLDSIYMGYDFSSVPTAYHSIVAKELGASLNQCAISACRTVELRYALDGVYNDYDDEYMWGNFYYGDDDGFRPSDFTDLLAARGVDYKEQAAKNDLITIGIGTNDIFSYAINTVMDDLQVMTGAAEDDNSGALIPGLRNFLGRTGLIGHTLKLILDTGDTVGSGTKLITKLYSTMLGNVSGYLENYRAILDYIYKVNPNATVVIVGLFNPCADLKLKSSSLIDLKIAVSGIVRDVNKRLREMAAEYNNCCYADVTGTEMYGVSLDDPDIWNNVFLKMHPTLAGHRNIAAGILAALPELEPLTFTDVPAGFWAYDDIRYVVSKNIMLGKSAATFEPDSNMTRAQFITILYRLAGSPNTDGYIEPFLDVSSGYWAYKAIVWGYNQGIISGVSPDMFMPDAGITRQQLVAMLYRYEGQPEVTGSLSVTDAAEISEYARDAVIWALSEGIVTGYADNTFRPMGTATRAHMAAIIARYMLGKNKT